MSQAFELLSGVRLAALAPEAQALEFLAEHHIPVITPYTPYRIEHPHSALVRKSEGLSRQDTLYTPSGRLTCKYTRPTEEEPWEPQGSFVRRSSQLGALTAFCQDMQAVALPDSLQPEKIHVWFWAQPSPFARLFREWIDPQLMETFSRGSEMKDALKALDALFEREAALLAEHHPAVIVMDELLTGAMARNELWRKHALKAAGKLRAAAPQAALAVTSRDLALEASLLPFEATVLHVVEPITQENAADLGKTLRPWLESPPERAMVLLSPSAPAMYPPLVHRLRLDT